MATTTSRAVQIDQNGGPEQLKIVQVHVGEPGPGEIRIRHKAVGLNFIDVYQRSGLYSLPLPLRLGMEGSGIVEAVGEGVTHLKVGDRAAYASQPPGAYCEARVMPAATVCRLPDAIGFETGAAMMLQGLTAAYLLATAGKVVTIHDPGQLRRIADGAADPVEPEALGRLEDDGVGVHHVVEGRGAEGEPLHGDAGLLERHGHVRRAG